MEQAWKLFEETLGYAPGDRISTPDAIERAVEAIAARWPAKCRLEITGRSVEGRPLQLLTIASEANAQRLDAIQAANVRLADPSADVEADLKSMPATAWVIANVHGDEHSTAEAALLLAFHFAATDDPVLNEVVVGIDPLQNPDGRARSVNAYYSLFGIVPRTDPWAAEHWEPWAGGRTNHYFFDMNRDWFPLTQPESRARVGAFLRWRPQVLADAHEMWWDSRFFFPPPAEPMNPNLGEHVLRWWSILGQDIASAFDAEGWDYWSGETFDAFYPGYGEAFPTLHGCTGMTYEQASAAGLGTERNDATICRFDDAIRHHFVAALSMCRTAAARRDELLHDVRAFFVSAADSCAAGPRAYVFPDAGAGKPAERMAETLQAQGILVERLVKDVDAALTPYEGGDAQPRLVKAGSLVVRLDQPEGRAARSVLERETAIDPDWLAEQVRRRSEFVDSEFYDHTAWSLPLALGVETWTTNAALSRLEPWTPAAPDVAGAEPAYGYLIPADGFGALKAACLLMKRGVRVHVAKRPFTLNGVERRRGTLVVKRADQGRDWETVCAEVRSAAGAAGAALLPARTSWTDAGISLGSDEVTHVKPPRVAALYGEPGKTASYGWMAWLFEQELGLDFTPIRAGNLKEADLRRYDVIILPDGDADDYASHLNVDAWKSLHGWTRQGGTLIALGGAAACLCAKGKDWTTVKVVKDLRNPPPEPEKDKDKEPEIPLEHRPEKVAGAALRVELDRHSAATLGFGAESHVPFTSDRLLSPSVEGRNVAVFADEQRLTVAGFVWERMHRALPGKAYMVDETQGRGHVVLFADDPNQRGYWEVSSRLFVNAVLFGPR
ncbi:MAG TPA: M14 family metallopeptidase [Armatimonadota bacterium]|jgi:hypothetical protein